MNRPTLQCGVQTQCNKKLISMTGNIFIIITGPLFRFYTNLGIPLVLGTGTCAEAGSDESMT